jgi:hypothetical protein
MTISPRTKTLLDPMPKDHPLTPPMQAAMIAGEAANEGFAGHKIALASDRRVTELGQRQKLQEELVGNHGKQWAKASAAVQKARQQITARDAALVIKDPDRSYAGVHGRWEARQWLLSLEPSVRHAVAETTDDIRILEAMVTAPPQLSGVNLPALAAKIERRYKEVMYSAELAAIAADDAVVAAAEAGMGIAYNEMRSTIDMRPHDFDELMKPIVAAELKAAAPSGTHAAPTEASKTAPDDPKPAALFSPEEYKELWRPFDELVAGIANRGAA